MSLIPDGLDDLKFDRLFSYLLTEEKHSKCNSEQKRRCTLNCHFDTTETSSGLYSPLSPLVGSQCEKQRHSTWQELHFFSMQPIYSNIYRTGIILIQIHSYQVIWWQHFKFIHPFFFFLEGKNSGASGRKLLILVFKALWLILCTDKLLMWSPVAPM